MKGIQIICNSDWFYKVKITGETPEVHSEKRRKKKEKKERREKKENKEGREERE